MLLAFEILIFSPSVEVIKVRLLHSARIQCSFRSLHRGATNIAHCGGRMLRPVFAAFLLSLSFAIAQVKSPAPKPAAVKPPASAGSSAEGPASTATRLPVRRVVL